MSLNIARLTRYVAKIKPCWLKQYKAEIELKNKDFKGTATPDRVLRPIKNKANPSQFLSHSGWMKMVFASQTARVHKNNTFSQPGLASDLDLCMKALNGETWFTTQLTNSCHHFDHQHHQSLYRSKLCFQTLSVLVFNWLTSKTINSKLKLW